MEYQMWGEGTSPLSYKKINVEDKNMINHQLKNTTMFLSMFALIILQGVNLYAQENHGADFDRDTLITAAREMMTSIRYCGLITLDEAGHPQVRTMDAFVPEEDMVVWFGTNPTSRKVKEIKNDPRVTLYYEDKDHAGYVVLRGQATLVDDADLKLKYWKEEWNEFYTDQKDSYLLIKVIPKSMEIIDYRRGIVGDPKTWTVPRMEFD
jgi:general stress protein 26